MGKHGEWRALAARIASSNKGKLVVDLVDSHDK